MKDAHLAKQDHGHSASLALDDLSPKVTKESLDVLLLAVGTRRVGGGGCKYARPLALHVAMVLPEGTMRKRLSLMADGIGIRESVAASPRRACQMQSRLSSPQVPTAQGSDLRCAPHLLCPLLTSQWQFSSGRPLPSSSCPKHRGDLPW